MCYGQVSREVLHHPFSSQHVASSQRHSWWWEEKRGLTSSAPMAFSKPEEKNVLLPLVVFYGIVLYLLFSSGHHVNCRLLRDRYGHFFSNGGFSSISTMLGWEFLSWMAIGFCHMLFPHWLTWSWLFFFCSLLMWWFTLIDFWMLNQSCIPGINPICLCFIILFIHCWIRFANICWGFLRLCWWVILVCSFPFL